MIDRQQLLADLKPLLKELETDLRARCDEVPQINAGLKAEYDEARAADRTGVTYEEWRADLITQVAVAWVLSCVFVRFLEDNALIAPPRLAGPQGPGNLQRARDERETYFKAHAKQTDRDYLLAVFAEVGKLPGTKEVFGKHNPVSEYPQWLSGDAAQKLIEFFQKIDTDGTGDILHDFTDAAWDTRFLGDLYQDLSEAARKKYALLQTPIFVEEFILDRTLEPAINEFGLSGLKMIDPACGSGHFVLGAFARILSHWRKAEPGTSDRELVNRALASVHGVDLNPYAVAIARFRLLLAAMKECQVTRLKDAPNFQFNLACGDSLLHGSASQEVMGFHELAHHYQSEDIDELRRILKPGQYHTVVANPPYITVKDRALNQAYRDRYRDVCHMKYSLSVPFLQRLFVLACVGGYTGQITANSFMRREFGKKLVENYLPRIDLTHVIDTSLCFIPGHGTPTVILIARNRPPVTTTIRAVGGIQRENGEPADPAKGLVWSAILDQIDRVGSESAFVSVSNTPRGQFGKHPWSIGGGGAAELKVLLDETGDSVLSKYTISIGPPSFTGIDEMFLSPAQPMRRVCVAPAHIRPLCIGEQVRDWSIVNGDSAFVPYGNDQELITFDVNSHWARRLWPYRPCSEGMVSFGRQTRKDLGEIWWSWYRWIPERYRTPLSIVFAFVSTHNHFVLDRGEKVFKQSAPVIKLPVTATEGDHLAILGLLNSSTACFWCRQTMHDKGGGGIGGGIAAETWERFLEFTSTGIQRFPLPVERSLPLAEQLDTLSRALSQSLPPAVVSKATPNAATLAEARQKADYLLGRMIALQEEFDWHCYGLYRLIPADQANAVCYANPPDLKLGQRAFEVILACKMKADEEETTWFERHGSTPITEIPAEWPKEYSKVVQKRIELIESDHNIGLIERPEYKRRWNTEPWEEQQERALRNWLLDRLEGYFDLDGRMNDRKEVTAHGSLRQPRLTSIAQVADIARADKDFMQVAELYRGRADFDVAGLVQELIESESVPHLPVLRYKPTGIDKRAAWERTWTLQRLEDAIDALFEVERLKKVQPSKVEQVFRPAVWAIAIDEAKKAGVLRELVSAAAYVAEATKQKLNLGSDPVRKPVTDAAKQAKKHAVGDIPVPPRYTSADFLSSGFWRLRGKLDVPKERWVSYPQCEGEDGSLVIAWAGYDHLQLARAVAERYEVAKEHEGRKLVPLLASIGHLVPWLKQWHNDLDPAYGTRMGDYFEGYLAEEAKALGMSVEQVMAWQPPPGTNGRGRGRKKKVKA
jgi:hypothetical protein